MFAVDGSRTVGLTAAVSVGSFADPRDTPGLAHLTEHMVRHDFASLRVVWCPSSRTGGVALAAVLGNIEVSDAKRILEPRRSAVGTARHGCAAQCCSSHAQRVGFAAQGTPMRTPRRRTRSTTSRRRCPNQVGRSGRSVWHTVRSNRIDRFDRFGAGYSCACLQLSAALRSGWNDSGIAE